MAGTRKIAAILIADIVGFSRLAGAHEDSNLSRQRGCAAIYLIELAVDADHGRLVKHTGGGSLIEFRSIAALRAASVRPSKKSDD